ncbi:MAG TPA: 3-dehydroquinate synthase [Ferruginibacter sp.]|nr:3-dehydroquinate synthase [Ferruginibacter sp.]
MRQAEYQFSRKKVTCYFDAGFELLETLCKKDKCVIITDDHVYDLHLEKFSGFRVIKMTPGEEHKNQQIVDRIIERLIDLEMDKQCFIVGVGGGVVSDMAGYVASIYKRGVKLALVPTTILGMVDAAIGGKNGIDLGVYKNMVGTIYQPEFILYDYRFLETLPVKEWINGFAEIIKHACIKDALLFRVLERYSLHDIQADTTLIASLIEQNVEIKMGIVTSDEFEDGDRKLLNFGHTFGHAIENLHEIPHGHAVSIGMVAACNLSEKLNNLHFEDAQKVVRLLSRYHLPVDIETDHEKVFEVMKLDKKRADDQMQFVMLNKIGEARTKPVALSFLHENIKSIL